MTFETPGLVTRDFHVAGAVIGGVLVNEWTGEAITQAAGARVSALGGTKTRVATFSSVDEAGRFSMQGLPAGDYRLTVTADGYPVKWVRVSVEENEVRDDLRVEMPPGGQVVFEFRGFEGLGLDEFQLELRSKPPGTGFNRGGSLEEDGSGESEFVVCAGDYEAALLFESWGSMKARFSVAVDETTRVILTPDDRVGGEVRTVTVEGWITRADHSPLGGTRFMVFPRDVPGLEIGSHDRTPQADTEGHFALEGMRPGTWIVVGILADGTEHTFPDIVIPSDAPDPFEVSLIFHAGKVIGRFVDALTGEAFPPSEPLWRAELHDVNTGDLVSEVRKGERGPRMELASIPAGEHRLSIVARGFQDLELASVHVAEGEVVDVGELSLEPSGTLDLELTDADGEPVVNVDISCNGVKLRPFQLEGLTPTSCRCYNLPFGTVTISVKAEGFAAEECDVLLEPGITGQASLVVHPK